MGGASASNTTDYDRVARIYEPLAWLWSGGRIQRCRRAVARWVRPGDRVLVLGVGTGTELRSLEAASPRCVVGVDTSAAMLQAAQRNHDRSWLVRADAVEWLRPEAPRFDVLYAPFFLNLFAEPHLHQWLRNLRKALPEHGRLLIADFAPPSPRRIRTSIQQLQWRLPMTICRRWAGGETHRLHDLDRALADSGFTAIERVDFGWPGVPGYSAWCAKPAEP